MDSCFVSNSAKYSSWDQEIKRLWLVFLKKIFPSLIYLNWDNRNGKKDSPILLRADQITGGIIWAALSAAIFFFFFKLSSYTASYKYAQIHLACINLFITNTGLNIMVTAAHLPPVTLAVTNKPRIWYSVVLNRVRALSALMSLNCSGQSHSWLPLTHLLPRPQRSI